MAEPVSFLTRLSALYFSGARLRLEGSRPGTLSAEWKKKKQRERERERERTHGAYWVLALSRCAPRKVVAIPRHLAVGNCNIVLVSGEFGPNT